MAVLTIRVNTLNKAITQYSNFEFNSIGKMNGKKVALASDGIYELSGNTDDGTNISSRFDLPYSDFGSAYNKRIRKMYVGCNLEENMTISVSDDENRTASYTLSPVVANKNSTAKVNGQRYGNKGAYYQLSIVNTLGGYFDIDFIKIIPVIINRTPVNL